MFNSEFIRVLNKVEALKKLTNLKLSSSLKVIKSRTLSAHNCEILKVLSQCEN